MFINPAVKQLILEAIKSATDKISEDGLVGDDFIWGAMTDNFMADAAFSALAACVESQKHAIEQEYLKPVA